MKGWCNGRCTACKSIRLVADLDKLDDNIKEYYCFIFPGRANKKNTLCNQCYGNMVNKYYKKSIPQKNTSSTNTTNSTTNSSNPSSSNYSNSSASENYVSQEVDSNPNQFVTSSSSSNSKIILDKRFKPAPLSIKLQRRRKAAEQIVQDISSDEDEDVFEPDVRCPNYQPLIKRRRTRVSPPPSFADHNAPIFDTSRITGG